MPHPEPDRRAIQVYIDKLQTRKIPARNLLLKLILNE
jgi:hypothetical protein